MKNGGKGHTIETLTFDIQISQEKDYQQVADVISSITEVELPQLLQELLDTYHIEDQTIQIEKIELDLGDISLMQSRGQLISQFKNSLQHWFKKTFSSETLEKSSEMQRQQSLRLWPKPCSPVMASRGNLPPCRLIANASASTRISPSASPTRSRGCSAAPSRWFPWGAISACWASTCCHRPNAGSPGRPWAWGRVRMFEWLTRKVGKARLMRILMCFYPPYIGAGVRVRHISDDFRDVQVSMGLGWYNRNYVGTHFGGSLYSMIDPFFMLMLMENLGRDYIVWDKSADIDFISPGKGPVFARFRIDQGLLDEVREHTANGEKYLPQLRIDIHDGAGTLVARVEKTLYVRLKPQARQA